MEQVKDIPNSIEDERLKLAQELGLTTQKLVADEKTTWQIIEKQKEWIWFDGGENLASYLFKKHGLFKNGFWIFSFGDYSKMKEFTHDLGNYPQRIPMGVLLKYKEAKESGIFSQFYVIDPDLKAMKVDPFLIGTPSGFYRGYRCAIICSWEDKSK